MLSAANRFCAEKHERSSSSIIPPQLPRHIPSLDGLRAISIILVIIGHATFSARSAGILRHLDHLGNIGVRCFFVISGFLITTLLLQEHNRAGEILLRDFYYRRVLRIFPAALAYIGAVALLASAGYIVLKQYDLVHALTYTMNYHFNRAVWLDHLWSLSVEEQFYILWPGIIVFFGARRARTLAWSAIALAPVIRAVMWFIVGASMSAMTKHFEANADSLASGCVLAMSYNWLSANRLYTRLRLSTRFLPVALSLIAVGNLVYLVSSAAFYLVGQTLANLGTVLSVDWCIRRPDSMAGSLLNYRAMVYIGTLSYSLYLWQGAFLNDAWSWWPGHFPFNIMCAFGMAMVSHNAIEKPFLKLKELRRETREAVLAA